MSAGATLGRATRVFIDEKGQNGSIYSLINESSGEVYLTKDSAFWDGVAVGKEYSFDYEITAKGNKLIKSKPELIEDEPAEVAPSDVDPEQEAADFEEQLAQQGIHLTGEIRPSAMTQLKKELLIAAWQTVKLGGFALENDQVHKEALEKLAKPGYKALTGTDWDGKGDAS